VRDRQGKARPKKTGNNNDTEAGGVFFFLEMDDGVG